MRTNGGAQRMVATAVAPSAYGRLATAVVAVLATATLAVGGTLPAPSAAPAGARPAGPVSLAVLRSPHAPQRLAARARRCALSARPRHARRCPVVGRPMPAPAGYRTKLFDDMFAGTVLNRADWNTYITSRAANGSPWNANAYGGSGMNPGGFDAEYFSPAEVKVSNGLALDAARGSTRPGYSWTAGALSTYGKFQFDGGYVQIKAKMPAGAGMWPGLWMLPGPGGRAGDNNEIDIFEGNYLMPGAAPDEVDAWHLHTLTGVVGGATNVGANLTAGYHVYGLRWVPGQSLTWYVDDKVVGAVTRAQSTIPDEPMELILDLQVADASASGWRTTANAATPSPSTMKVAEVQVYR